ncbi:MAG: hypothetical protein AAF206_04830 [Bacteroidota bacterium]
MKKYILLLICCGFFMSGKAQPFFAYQTTGVHTWFVSLSWDQKAQLGVGYQYRFFNSSTFTDLSAEVKMPLDDVFNGRNMQFITGIFKPVNALNDRGYTTWGLHARFASRNTNDTQRSLISLQGSIMPGHAYSAPLNGSFYSTVGLRLSAEVVIANQASGQWQYFQAHRLAVGGHLDGHFDRSVGFSSHVMYNLFLQDDAVLVVPDQFGLPVSGDLYYGTTYYLRRD